MKKKIHIIGGGLAGCELAYQLSLNEIFTNLYDKRSHQNLNSKFLANIYILKIKISNFIIFKIISKFVLFKEKLKKLLKILIKPFVS